MILTLALIAAYIVNAVPQPIPANVTDPFWHAAYDVSVLSGQLEAAKGRQQAATRDLSRYCGTYRQPAQVNSPGDQRNGLWVCVPKTAK